MTTAAYDGKTLAVDKQATAGNLKYKLESKQVNVIKNPDGTVKYLMCFCGEFQDGRVVLDWLRNGGDRPKLPEREDVNFAAILVDAQGKCWRTEEALEMWEVPVPHAIGSGRDFAIAAMRCGKNAVEAVNLASEFDIYTGFGVDAVTISEVPHAD